MTYRELVERLAAPLGYAYINICICSATRAMMSKEARFRYDGSAGAEKLERHGLLPLRPPAGETCDELFAAWLSKNQLGFVCPLRHPDSLAVQPEL